MKRADVSCPQLETSQAIFKRTAPCGLLSIDDLVEQLKDGFST